MAPNDLWKLSIEGTRQIAGQLPSQPPLGRWALTWYATANAPGYFFQRAIDLWQAIESWYGVGASNGLFATGTYITYVQSLHVQSEEFLEFNPDSDIGSTPVGEYALPFQVSILAWGNAKELRRQVRHWFTGWNSRCLDRSGRIEASLTGQINAWVKGWFVPRSSGTSTFTPVVYDEATETARSIVSIHRAGYWRTIRRRAVDVDLPDVTL